MTPAKWHGGGSIFEGISMVRFASQATFRTAAYLDTSTKPMAFMPITISNEERLARIEAYLHKRYLYLKEKPRTSFEEMELLKEFGFDEPTESTAA